jgi:hypothetical protein
MMERHLPGLIELHLLGVSASLVDVAHSIRTFPTSRAVSLDYLVGYRRSLYGESFLFGKDVDTCMREEGGHEMDRLCRRSTSAREVVVWTSASEN